MMSLLPREHGAYGQIAFPLVTAYAVAGVTTASLLIGLAAVAAFLAHEPLLVLVGRRGVRVRRERFVAAAAWFTVTVVTAAAAGIAAIWSVPFDVRWSFLLPLVPAAFLAAFISAKLEKTTLAEIAVALAFSLTAVPICLAAHASVGAAFGVGIVFALIFVTGTLAVRGVVLAVRAGGAPHAARSARIAVVVLSTAAIGALAAASSTARLPWATMVAAIPGLISATTVAMFPPSPMRLRAIGWMLITTSAAATLILVVGLTH